MHILLLSLIITASASADSQTHLGSATRNGDRTRRCTNTTVAILGGGMAGIAAAQALVNATITDFVVLEYRDVLGGRAYHTQFGQDKNGDPYTVELGANWIQGLGSCGGPENPVWTLAKKYNLSSTYSNYSSILTYNETGFTDYSNVIREYDHHNMRAVQRAGQILKDNLQDETARSGYALAGWRPSKDDMAAQAVEWWNWDWENAYSPETSSFVFGIAGENLTFNQFSDENNFVTDSRGYSTIIKGEAYTFFEENDPRLRLNTRVAEIQYSDDGVIIHNADNSCVTAAYAICTFSLGVLQNHAVKFSPRLPDWKRTSIEKFNMGTYTKIFLQFDKHFWPNETEFFLYASPTTRGYYPVFQSLSKSNFFPESSIILATVVSEQAYRVENMDDAETKREIMAVLRQMFPSKDIPEPKAFMYPRWTKFPWAYGSYSNWPAGTTLEMHENLRANVGRLWFAGEATSAEYFGFLHGAYFEGRVTGEEIGALLKNDCVVIQGTKTCGLRLHYERLNGTTPLKEYNFFNGWPVSSFYNSDSQ